MAVAYLLGLDSSSIAVLFCLIRVWTIPIHTTLCQLWCSGGQRWMGSATPRGLRGALQLRTLRILTQVHRLQRYGWQGQGQEEKVSCHSGVWF